MVRLLEIVEQFKILLVDSVLLFLDCFDDLGLSFSVIWSTICIAWNLGRVILLAPLWLRHMYPSLRLGFHFNCWSWNVHVGGTSDISSLSYRLSMTVKMLKVSEPMEFFVPWNDHNSSLDGQIKRWEHTLSIKKPGRLELFANFCAYFVQNLKHALFLHHLTRQTELNFLVEGKSLCSLRLPYFIRYELG